MIAVCAAGVARADLRVHSDSQFPIEIVILCAQQQVVLSPFCEAFRRPVQGPIDLRCEEDLRARFDALKSFGFEVQTCLKGEGIQPSGAIDAFFADLRAAAPQRATWAPWDMLERAHADLLAGRIARYPNMIDQVGVIGLLRLQIDPTYAALFGDGITPSYVSEPTQPLLPADPRPQILFPRAPVDGCEAEYDRLQSSELDSILGGLFCAAREHAVAQGKRTFASYAVSGEDMLVRCEQIRLSFLQTFIGLPKGNIEADLARARYRAETVGLVDPALAQPYGEICLGLGYERDDRRMALTAAILLLSAGKRGYGEIVAHHLREGTFGQAHAEAARTWYQWTVEAIDAGAVSVFDGEEREDGIALIRALLERDAL
jgi:hypothetical protein